MALCVILHLKECETDKKAKDVKKEKAIPTKEITKKLQKLKSKQIHKTC